MAKGQCRYKSVYVPIKEQARLGPGRLVVRPHVLGCVVWTASWLRRRRCVCLAHRPRCQAVLSVLRRYSRDTPGSPVVALPGGAAPSPWNRARWFGRAGGNWQSPSGDCRFSIGDAPHGMFVCTDNGVLCVGTVATPGAGLRG